MFASGSRLQVLGLQQKLLSVRLGSKSFMECMAEISAIVEALAVAGDKVDETDLVLLMLGGMGEEY